MADAARDIRVFRIISKRVRAAEESQLEGVCTVLSLRALRES